MTRVRPNLHTLALGLIAVTMWYAGAAQQNGGAYILAFLTVAMAAVSMIQARANLRGVRVAVGVIPPSEAGKAVRVPLSLTVEDGREPCGLEITGLGVALPIFIDKISVEQPTRVDLLLSEQQLGRHDEITILVRSYYPLGIFTAQKAITLTQGRTILPRPEGVLPLPASSESRTDGGEASSKPGKIGAGDDFAGARPWQVGDPLRHVDWKAVARGRPMMVKLWAGSSGGMVWLNWADLDLPHEQRVRQMAKWIDEAELSGTEYGLRLPDQTLPPASGSEHRRQCLEALARLAQEAESQGVSAKEKVAPSDIATCETRSELPGKPMRFMLIALALVALPMLSALPIVGSLVYYGAILWRWFTLKKQRQPVPLIVRLGLIVIGVGATFLQTHTFIGIEPGVAIMLCVTAGKILESSTPRDVQVLAVLGWFLCMCNLALEQAIGHSVWAYGSFFLIALAVVRLRRGVAGVGAPAHVTAKLFMQAAPFVVLLFFIFPRGASNMVVRVTRSLSSRTGMSDNMDPGSIAAIARSNEIAFRVSLEGKSFRDLPPTSRYWRCGVLWDCEVGNGLRWQPSTHADMPQTQPDPKTGYLQRIQLLPHGGKWLPALDVPTIDRRGNHDHYWSKGDNTLQSESNVNSMRTYEVVSHLQVPYTEANATRLAPALKPPLRISKRVRDLANSFKTPSAKPEDIVRSALAHLRTGGYEYSIEPGEYNATTGLDDFLFTRRLGFCEHYAGAFATLMRVAGVPARVVIGYQGGDYVQSSGYLIVRQSDAHAWTEVFMPNKGWQRVDPTAALAPQRISGDLRAALGEGAETALGLARGSWLGGIAQEVEMLVDQANYFWYDRVVQYDELKQQDLFIKLGFFQMSPFKLGAVGIALFGVPLLGLSLWLNRKARHPDPAVRLWQSFCARLAKQGVARAPGEGPLDYARRASALLPAQSERIDKAARTYTHYRYGAGVSLPELRAALAGR